MAKTKRQLVNLDEVLKKDLITTISADEVIKMKDAKFGGPKKVPSIMARGLWDQLIAKPNEGKGVNADGLSAETKEGLIRTLRKELARCAKGAKRDDLRVRVQDQGNRLAVFLDKKKAKGDEKKSTKK